MRSRSTSSLLRAPATSRSSPASAAFAVLTSPTLLLQVTQFQKGIPVVVYELTKAYDAMPYKLRRADQQTHNVPHCWARVMRFGDLASVQLIYDMKKLHFTGLGMKSTSVAEFAAVCGRLDVIQWLHADGKLKPRKSQEMLSKAVQHQHDHVTTWLLANYPDVCRNDAPQAIQDAAKLGNLLMMRKLVSIFSEARTSQAMDAAVRGAQWDIIHYLHQNSPAGCTKDAMDSAAAKGSLEVVKFLHEHRNEGCTTKAMDDSARNGHLEVVRFLHENRTEGCTVRAMNKASKYGHEHVVRFLHEHRSEGCTAMAMNRAARNGHFAVVQFLHANRTECDLSFALSGAASGGHLCIVRFAHDQLARRPTTRAMDNAAKHGHLEVVQFLHENRSEGCTTRAMDGAAKRGHLRILQYLHENRTEGCTQRALTSAAEAGHLHIVKFLHETLNVAAPEWLLAKVLEDRNLELVRYIHEVMGQPFYSDSVNIAKIFRAGKVVEYVKRRIQEIPVAEGLSPRDPDYYMPHCSIGKVLKRHV